MEKLPLFFEKSFHNEDFSHQNWVPGEYEDCTFVGCNFEHADWSGSRFLGCVFRDSNCSLVALHRTAFLEVTFEGCKLLGLRMEHVNPIGFFVRCQNCTLDHSSWYRVKMKKFQFVQCSLVGVDFTDADLTEGVLTECTLTNATFEGSILERADLRSSMGFSLDPLRNKLKGARFSLQGLPGLLEAWDLRIDP
jgi:uncharacterized protein YjbI with pentapeptide repeats